MATIKQDGKTFTVELDVDEMSVIWAALATIKPEYLPSNMPKVKLAYHRLMLVFMEKFKS